MVVVVVVGGGCGGCGCGCGWAVDGAGERGGVRGGDGRARRWCGMVVVRVGGQVENGRGGGGWWWGVGMHGVGWGGVSMVPLFLDVRAAERSMRFCARVLRKAPRACGWRCRRRHPARRNTESRTHKIEVCSESGICRTGQYIFTMASAEMRAGANERYMLRHVFCISEVNNSSCGLMDKAPPS